ncbi:MAG: (Fe-S)-binding protein [Alphaproteobacteria bacterium]|nr:MAG: (Fe-S)-binding protein [Alphaproteobacteria bacterium]
MAEASTKGKRVALFATCLVDLMRPNVGFAAARLIEDAGYQLEVPEGQTCCGQPAYNGGDRAAAVAAALYTIDVLSGFDYVVLPSGSCAAMISRHYPTLFEKGSANHDRAVALAARTFELTVFLADIAKTELSSSSTIGAITYHDSCSGLRELGIHDQPRKLLSAMEGVTISEMKNPDTCCGFGGTFCIKYPEISSRLAERKASDIVQTGASTLVAGDVGCMLNIEGKLHRQGSDIKVRHVAEILADMVDD